MNSSITLLVCLTSVLFANMEALELTPSKNVKIVIFTPESHADIICDAFGNAGAGKMGNYDFCSFSVKGIGRWRANDQASPTIGEKGLMVSTAEERIETIVPIEHLKDLILAIKKVHPYEEVGYDVYPLLDIQ